MGDINNREFKIHLVQDIECVLYNFHFVSCTTLNLCLVQDRAFTIGNVSLTGLGLQVRLCRKNKLPLCRNLTYIIICLPDEKRYFIFKLFTLILFE